MRTDAVDAATGFGKGPSDTGRGWTLWAVTGERWPEERVRKAVRLGVSAAALNDLVEMRLDFFAGTGGSVVTEGRCGASLEWRRGGFFGDGVGGGLMMSTLSSSGPDNGGDVGVDAARALGVDTLETLLDVRLDLRTGRAVRGAGAGAVERAGVAERAGVGRCDGEAARWADRFGG